MIEKYRGKPESEMLPQKSIVEDETEEMFYDFQVTNEADLDKIISNVFSEICGEYGKQEFFKYTLPAVKQIYSTNYRKAGLRLLEIINEGAAHKPAVIAEYFRTVIPKEEEDYSIEPKEKIIKDIVTEINSIILKKKTQYGEKYKGIVAVIIHVSFARKNFSLNSDLDLIYISESQEDGIYFEDEDKYINYKKDFEYNLARKIRPPIDNFYGVYYIGDEYKFKELADTNNSPDKDTYIIVSPYPEKKQQIRSLIALK